MDLEPTEAHFGGMGHGNAMTFAIIGAGLAGLACAGRLVEAGRRVVLYDKGHRPGGRMSTRHLATVRGEAGFDHGAQYLTARDPAFLDQVETWRREGLVAPWPAAGGHAYVGTPGMSAPAVALAACLDVRSAIRVDRIAREPVGWRLHGEGVDATLYDGVVVAVPAEQVASLVGPWDASMAARADAAISLPCWTIMAAFATRVSIDDDVVKERGPISWAARNSAKPRRSGPESWVIQGSPDWSRAHLEDEPEAAMAILLDAFAQVMGPLPALLASKAHRWRYAMSGRPKRQGPDWNVGLDLGVCGDWTEAPKLEGAWLSGYHLADRILASVEH